MAEYSRSPLYVWNELHGRLIGISVLPYLSDSPTGRDLLDIEHEVGALASLIASRKLQPPLSVGIFGKRGAGKSFFLRRVAGEVHRLAQASTEQYTNSLQISISAWEHAGSSPLLAVVDAIYSALETRAHEPDELLKATPSGRKLVQQAAARVESREDVERSTQAHRQDLKDTYDTTLKRYATIKVGKKWETVTKEFIAEIGPASAEIDKDGEKLGISKLSRNTEAFANIISGSKSIGGRAEILSSIKTVRRYLGTTFLVGGGFILAAIAIFFGFVVSGRMTDLADQVDTYFAGLAGIAALVGGIAAFATHIAQNQADKALKRLEVWGAKLETIVLRFDSTALYELTEAEGRIAATREQLRDSSARIEAAYDSVVEARRDRALLEKELTRNILDSYIRQLDNEGFKSIVSTVRADLEVLSSVCIARTDPERIVLYIDDLDRADPEAVVGFLHTIQQLLSFPAFAVVIAADPAYLASAIAPRYRELLVDSGSELHLRSQWQSGATSADFLGRLFQLHMWIAQPSPHALVHLIESMSPPTKREPPLGDEAGPASDESQAPAYADFESSHEKISTDQDQDAFTLTDSEIDYLSSLTPIIRTPRDLKRLINLYRMARLIVSAEVLAELIDTKGHPALLTLLAIIVLAPLEAPQYFSLLARGAGSRDDYADYLETRDGAPNASSETILALLNNYESATEKGAVNLLVRWHSLAERFALTPPHNEGHGRR